MAIAQTTTNGEPSLAALKNMLMPAVWERAGRAAQDGIPLLDADLSIDFVCDRLLLHVRYQLMERGDLYRGDWKGDIGPRLQAALRLFHRTTQAKAVCVDRRRLIARGEKASKAKSRRVTQ